MFSRLLILTALALVANPAQVGAAKNPLTGVRVGIADQKPQMFKDLRFLFLGVKDARLSVGWDALNDRRQSAQVAAWLGAARKAGVEPLITFGSSRRKGQFRNLPSQKVYRQAFRRFRTRYPWVENYATWNEANLCGQPTCRRPEVVARYYSAMRAECPSCRVLAAEVLDIANMTFWVRGFRRALGSDPKYWGLHNYVDANRFRTNATQRMLRATKGEIWLTETGGIVRRRNPSKIRLTEGEPHAAKAMRWLLDKIVPLSPRIKRVYLYHWNSSTARDGWDSAFIDYRGRPRLALEVLRNRLKK